MDKIYKKFENYIKNRVDHRFVSSLEDEDYSDMSMGLEDGEYRLNFAVRTEPLDPFMLMRMSTIRQFFIVFNYDEDYNHKHEIIKQQICIGLYSEWDDSEYSFHYFINEESDFDINKFENEINDYCNNLPYNNYNLAQDEVREIFKEIKGE